MRSEVQAVAWRSYWPVALLALTFLTVVAIFSVYIEARQAAADARAEKQRRAICAILANIPGHIPPEIAAARTAFGRHPGDCLPITRPARKSHPTPTSTVTVTPASRETVVIVRPARTVAPSSTPRPAPTRTGSPTPTPKPTPTPSSSRLCLPLMHICT